MAEAVVDQLEVVEVHVEHGHAEALAACPREGQAEDLLEHGPVGQLREVVVIGEERDLLLGVLAPRDVQDHAVPVAGAASWMADQGGLVAYP